MFIGVRDESGADVYPVMYTWSTAKKVAGTTVYYTHEKNEDADKVYIPGPTNEHLSVYVSIHISLYIVNTCSSNRVIRTKKMFTRDKVS